jgi:hypothetical protein
MWACGFKAVCFPALEGKQTPLAAPLVLLCKKTAAQEFTEYHKTSPLQAI